MKLKFVYVSEITISSKVKPKQIQEILGKRAEQIKKINNVPECVPATMYETTKPTQRGRQPTNTHCRGEAQCMEHYMQGWEMSRSSQMCLLAQLRNQIQTKQEQHQDSLNLQHCSCLAELQLQVMKNHGHQHTHTYTPTCKPLK